MDKRLILTAQDHVDGMEKQIDALVSLLGYEGALVTDESQFTDFLSSFEFKTLEAAQAQLNKLLTENGISTQIDVREKLVKAVHLILADYPDWPTKKVH